MGQEEKELEGENQTILLTIEIYMECHCYQMLKHPTMYTSTQIENTNQTRHTTQAHTTNIALTFLKIRENPPITQKTKTRSSTNVDLRAFSVVVDEPSLS